MKNILNVIWVLFWLAVYIFDPFSVLGLIGMAIFFIHILEIVIFWKRIKNNPFEGIVMTFVFGYVYLRGLRK